MDRVQHWNRNFEKKGEQNWIETEMPFIYQWIDAYKLNKQKTIFCAGVGDAYLVDFLVDQGHESIIANDLSHIALSKIEQRVGNEQVTYLQDNLVAPQKLSIYHHEIDVYIDRATLHFFTKPEDQEFYFDQLSRLMKTDGIVFISVFNENNRAKCCGLDLQLWNLDNLEKKLKDFDIIEVEEEQFLEKNGNLRNYIHLMAKKK